MSPIAFLFAFIICAYGTPLQYDEQQLADNRIHIPNQCSDVLSVQVCKKLNYTAKKLKLKAEDVKQAVIDAVKNGKTKAVDIYDSAKKMLHEKFLSKDCEDFLPLKACEKYRALSKRLNIAAGRFESALRGAYINGAMGVYALSMNVDRFYKNNIKNKKCEDYLNKSKCDQIKNVATKLKLKTDEWKDAFASAVLQAKLKGTEIVTTTFTKFRVLAQNTTCESLLNPTLCATLRKYAKATKIAFPKILDVVKSAIINGAKVGKGLLTTVYNKVDSLYDCEDVFTESSCKTLKRLVSVIGVKASQVNDVVRKFVRQGIELGKSLYKKIYKFLQDKVVCKINPFCKDSDISKRSVDDAELDAELEALKDVIKELEEEMVNDRVEEMEDTEEKEDDFNENVLENMKAAFKQITNRINAVAQVVKNIIEKKFNEPLTKQYKDLIDRMTKKIKDIDMAALIKKSIEEMGGLVKKEN